ncbi:MULTISPECIES: DedA family protein [Thalassolituus]|uniref:DedA family protein n=2 Tax=Oceanospirillaceae TaxID=135620 RepID=UPI0026495EFA|nr:MULTISPECIES: DedA family protein [Thalassolituus]
MDEINFSDWGTGLLLFAVFSISLAESLAVIGLLVPGVGLLLALTLAAAAGDIPLWLWVACGTVGAFLGDGISFLLGQRAGPAVHRWRFFQRHPHWLTRGEAFFQRWGIWSIMTGRFIGPIRPVVPLVAGAMRMSSRQFWFANAVSSPAWGMAYLATMYWLGEAFRDTFDLPVIAALLALATLIALVVSVLVNQRHR